MLKFNSNIQKHIDDSKITNLKVELVKPETLLKPERLDLIVKYLLASDLITGNRSSFAKELYVSHLESINGFVETDSTGKIGYTDFYDAFISLIEDIKRNGLNRHEPIPINNDGIILDGAHRTAIAIALNLDVPIIRLDLAGHNYDFEFWKNSNVAEYQVDYILHKYILMTPNTHIGVIWPSSESNITELESLISDNAQLFLSKNLPFSDLGKINIVRALYAGESWLGSESNNFMGARQKSELCFASGDTARLVSFQFRGDIDKLKCRLRKTQGLGKHSIHISEDYSEKYKISQIILNQNSLHWVNHAKLRDNKWLFTLLSDYEQLIETSTTQREAVCLAGSTVLAAYGLRSNRDIDYLSTSNTMLPEQKEIGNYNKEYKTYASDPLHVIHNPKNYFYFFGLKMQSLYVLRAFKEARSEPKDLDDIQLIDTLTSKNSLSLSALEIANKLLSRHYLKGRVKFLLFKLRYYLFRLKRLLS